MRRAVLYESFSCTCQYFTSETNVNGGYGCDHPEKEETEEDNGKMQGRCHCFCCPLGIEAEQQDLTDPEHPDAVRDVDWDGLAEDGTIEEGEYLLITVGEDSSPEETEALYRYDRYMHRYDKEWLDAHGIPNSLAG